MAAVSMAVKSMNHKKWFWNYNFKGENQVVFHFLTFFACSTALENTPLWCHKEKAVESHKGVYSIEFIDNSLYEATPLKSGVKKYNSM